MLDVIYCVIRIYRHKPAKRAHKAIYLECGLGLFFVPLRARVEVFLLVFTVFFLLLFTSGRLKEIARLYEEFSTSLSNPNDKHTRTQCL